MLHIDWQVHIASLIAQGTLVDIDQYVLAPPQTAPQQYSTGPDRPDPNVQPTSFANKQVTQSTAPRPTPVATGDVIGEDNVGFKLLRKHGWAEGSGLGASGQGRTQPLPAIANAGRRGLGGVPPPPVKQQAQTAQRVQAALAAESREGAETKRKRIEQVAQAEADQEAERQLRRFMAREFADEGVAGGSTTDTNPLKRRNKLSASNPLL